MVWRLGSSACPPARHSCSATSCARPGRPDPPPSLCPQGQRFLTQSLGQAQLIICILFFFFFNAQYYLEPRRSIHQRRRGSGFQKDCTLHLVRPYPWA